MLESTPKFSLPTPQPIADNSFATKPDKSTCSQQEGFLYAEESGDTSYRSFFKQCACHIAQAIAPGAFRRKVEVEELLERWESEEQGKGKWH